MSFFDADEYIKESEEKINFMKLSTESFYDKKVSGTLDKAINLQAIVLTLTRFIKHCESVVEDGSLTYSETLEVKYLIERMQSAMDRASLENPFNPKDLLVNLTEMFDDLQTPTSKELELIFTGGSGIAFRASEFFKRLSELI